MIIAIIAVILAFGAIASTIGTIADLSSLFGARNRGSRAGWPDPKELVVDWDFENGMPNTTYRAETAEIVQLTGNKALKKYMNMNSTADSYFHVRAERLPEKYQDTNPDTDEIVFGSSIIYVSIDLMRTANQLYQQTFQFKGGDGKPLEDCWCVLENGTIVSPVGEQIGKLKENRWTTVGIRIDMDARTFDYYYNGKYVTSCSFDYEMNMIKYFNLWGPAQAETRSIYIDNIQIFYEEK